MDKNLPNFKHMNKEDGKVYGAFNTVKSVNPYNCRFIVKYPDGKVIEGKDLFDTGWDDIPHGFTEFSYILSTGHVIKFPKFSGYLPLIECSNGLDGSRIFHSINVKCLAKGKVVVYKVMLKQDNKSTYKIGDIIIYAEDLPERMTKSWKYTS